MLTKMVDLCYENARRAVTSTYETGVVFAGYGESEILPAIKQLTVDGKYGREARVWVVREHNLSDKDSSSAYIIPFAQADIAYLFMEGILLDYLKFIGVTIFGLLNEKSNRLINDYVPNQDREVERARQKKDNGEILSGFFDEFKEFRKEDAIIPILNVVSTLPKEEMAAMAEAFVEITSLRRKIDSPIESVGGPVDVAIISKSDGFVWIKRKHYFELELNRDFMVRRQRRFEGMEP